MVPIKSNSKNIFETVRGWILIFYVLVVLKVVYLINGEYHVLDYGPWPRPMSFKKYEALK